MSLVQVYIPTEGAATVVSEIGELGVIEFRDLNPNVNAFQRAFVSDIRRFDEMERKLRFLAAQMEKASITAQPLMPDEEVGRVRTAQEMISLEAILNNHETRVLSLNDAYAKLLRTSLELTEQNCVLQRTTGFFQVAQDHQEEIRRSFEEPSTPLLQSQFHLEAGDDSQRIHLGFVAGVIARQRLPTFERVLWRALRGNLHMNHVEIDEPVTDPLTEEAVQKDVFVIFGHGAEIMKKIRKIAESLGGTIYNIDANADMRRDHALNVQNRLEEVESVLESTKAARIDELNAVARSLNTWMTLVKKEKAVYHTMNLFNYDVNSKCLIAEGWCATNRLHDIRRALQTARDNGNMESHSIVHVLPTNKEPPTFHRTNKFTEGFQSIVDAYGIARYGEVNPGLFTVISFPFLFALMFGDLGHGAIMAAFAAWICVRERKLAHLANDELFGMVYHGRYIVLLMGLFSMYTGFIYNDIFSRPMHVWHSGWEWRNVKANQTAEAVSVGVYPMGVDPVWHGADNALLFTNSYKMKMSILFGVLQMSFGIVLTIFNHLHFKKRSSIWAEFVPQMLFMQSIFGYLSLCILYKWSVDWYATDANGAPLRGQPPSLLNMLIFMFLQPGTVKPEDQLFAGQATVQAVLLLMAVVCVPWMLLAKPLLMKAELDRTRNAGYDTVPANAPVASNGAHDQGVTSTISTETNEDGNSAHTFGDLMIHQSIHTIEFCLNSISNTASYLRLWALSLAHAQLSSVLWDMVIAPCFYMKGTARIFALFIAFAFWFITSVGILIVMEGLSAFLHALRLHWVEFNSKFYEGSGRKFVPFSFTDVLTNEGGPQEQE
ncbi:V-type ATPase, V0 complex, 116kDa subunit family [Syncephalis pseudoplumigaleata]|uniref:V-type proton ATPase subunit a n=1 Tax=Syncephalis pseudoplumigaleata TaxID=1712513 RepID=A0A4P9Z1D0_9FUNG|nr:V-type ATPase, V0 complex, 116kDa subunit family [Syncephalis pseudoplumigaleata]|eukprot:RKP26287.1 V-type ATPase, V0 complex, 116kDa subunit family [Syncephalis pseudoplumigaleata]